ncbi:hypothetical protein NEIRO03_1020 [Nematocida sp. AWRm78]|nr:hypothetical protein NEIRO02_1094 [Nematocida sp. AWRm79]KAI5183424.1 hypothetical protein NEIRO03_1020 [Nematocida sp. AWRm78]
MSAISLLCSIIQVIKPNSLILTGKDSELRVFGTSIVDMHLSVSKSGMSSKLKHTVEVRTNEFFRLLKECRVFSDIHFTENDMATMSIKQEGYILQLECIAKAVDEIVPPGLNADIIVDLDGKLMKEIATKDCHSIQITFNSASLEIKVNGPIKVHAVQKTANYIKKKTKPYAFIMPADGFVIISKLCKLDPNRIIIGVLNNVCIFYIYFTDITLICHLAGTLLQLSDY